MHKQPITIIQKLLRITRLRLLKTKHDYHQITLNVGQNKYWHKNITKQTTIEDKKSSINRLITSHVIIVEQAYKTQKLCHDIVTSTKQHDNKANRTFLAYK